MSKFFHETLNCPMTDTYISPMYDKLTNDRAMYHAKVLWYN